MASFFRRVMITIDIDYKGKVPIYEQIYIYIRNEIRNGNIKVNDKLPSSRGFADYFYL